MKMLVRAAFAVFAGMIALPLLAADWPVGDPGFARIALADATRCILNAKPGLARSFLQAPVDSKDAVRLASLFNRSDCMQSASRAIDLEFTPALLRGAFYKEMYGQSVAGVPTVSGAVATPLDFRVQIARSSTDYEVMRQFAACVVQRDPATARVLVAAATESAAEAQAFTALQPAAGVCTIQGKAPRASKAMLIGLIAEALYRQAPGDGTGKPANG